METVPIFANYLVFDELQVSNRKDLISFCYKQVEEGKAEAEDNVSQSLFINPSEPVIQELGTLVNKRFDILHKERNFNKNYEQAIQKFWANVNNNANISMPHRHPESFFSAIYYPQVGKNPGTLSFLNPNQQHSYVITPDHIEEFDEFNSALFHVTPRPDLLIIFPSWLWHFVRYDGGDSEDRISIAFDTIIRKKNVHT
mgnify:FL=1